MSNFAAQFYPESTVGGFTNIDGTVAFFTRLRSLVNESTRVLDVGCGRGEVQDDPVPFRRDLRILKGRVAHVLGIDVDPAGEQNPFIDEFRVIQGLPWDVESNDRDIVISDYVIEHLEHPAEFFAEVRRVLRPDGFYCFRTSNKWNYISVTASLLPSKLHSRVLDKAQAGRKAEDTFKTYLRCNSLGKIRRTLRQEGFEPTVFGYEPEPRYLEFSKLAYRLGVWHQKFAPAWLRASLFGFCRRI